MSYDPDEPDTPDNEPQCGYCGVLLSPRHCRRSWDCGTCGNVKEEYVDPDPLGGRECYEPLYLYPTKEER